MPNRTLRLIQWGGPVLLVGLWWVDAPWWVAIPLTLVIFLLSLGAKAQREQRQKLAICHANMAQYIRLGGLRNQASSLYLYKRAK